MSTTVLRLPASLREALAEPAGPVYTDAEALLADAGRPLVAVGDIVTYHLLEAGVTPAVALVDERTERSAVEPAVSARITGASFGVVREVTNPAGTLTADLLSALGEAVRTTDPTLVAVDGEEDLATLPAVLAAPEGGTVVYGQPGEGMVRVAVGRDSTARMRALLGRMDGDGDRAERLLDR